MSNINNNSLWNVTFTSQANKQMKKLPKSIIETIAVLKKELEFEGPIQAEWYHFGKLIVKKDNVYHCHLNKGKPRYVSVWYVIDEQEKTIKICFLGTHEKVNYKNF